MRVARSPLVAAITCTSKVAACVAPSRLTSPLWSARRSFTWRTAGISAISSRKRVPPSASSNRPSLLAAAPVKARSEEHTSELQSHVNLVCRLLLEKKKKKKKKKKEKKKKKKKKKKK